MYHVILRLERSDGVVVGCPVSLVAPMEDATEAEGVFEEIRGMASGIVTSGEGSDG